MPSCSTLPPKTCAKAGDSMSVASMSSSAATSRECATNRGADTGVGATREYSAPCTCRRDVPLWDRREDRARMRCRSAACASAQGSCESERPRAGSFLRVAMPSTARPNQPKFFAAKSQFDQAGRGTSRRTWDARCGSRCSRRAPRRRSSAAPCRRWSAGVAALLVLTMSTEPSAFFTSQVQPEPKLPTALLVKASLKAS